jgi:glutamate carboxypeptidase
MKKQDPLLDYFRSNLKDSLELLAAMVSLESHSHDKPGIDALADFLAGEFGSRGCEAEVLSEVTQGNVLKAVWRGKTREKPLVMLGHLDTVWPRGSLTGRPFRIEDGKAYGPGVFDMKGGILLCLLVCQHLKAGEIELEKDIVFLFTSDEEIGSRAGLPYLEAVARNCEAVLCLEPSLPGGKVKTFRKGVGEFHIRVQGIPAHAGVDHEKGANAVLELSRLVVKLQNFTDYARGITVNVGRVRGGTASNVVAANAEADVDFRVPTVADGRWLEEQIRALKPSDARCSLDIQGGMNRPPLERTAEVIALYQKARSLATSLGMELGEGSTGGGSDGSYTAAMGIPTLDGLGVEGDGAHAVHEHIVVDDIPRRAALLCKLVRRIDGRIDD